jgi:hypothetical protein
MSISQWPAWSSLRRAYRIALSARLSGDRGRCSRMSGVQSRVRCTGGGGSLTRGFWPAICHGPIRAPAGAAAPPACAAVPKPLAGRRLERCGATSMAIPWHRMPQPQRRHCSAAASRAGGAGRPSELSRYIGGSAGRNAATQASLSQGVGLQCSHTGQRDRIRRSSAAIKKRISASRMWGRSPSGVQPTSSVHHRKQRCPAKWVRRALSRSAALPASVEDCAAVDNPQSGVLA